MVGARTPPPTMAEILRARGKLGPYPVPVDDAPPAPPDPAAVRAWAAENGIEVAARGPLPVAVVEQYRKAVR